MTEEHRVNVVLHIRMKILPVIHIFAETIFSVLMCFSLLTNTRRLLSVSGGGEGHLDAVHGVRFLSMCWVILGHAYLLMAVVPPGMSTYMYVCAFCTCS